MLTAERIARRELKDEVEHEITQAFGDCVLTRWRSAVSLPTLSIAVCDNGAECYVVSKDIGTFQRFLRDVRPMLDNDQEIAKILRLALPLHLSVLPHRDSTYINRKTGHRDPPYYDGSALVFYCNDYHLGKVLRVTIHPDHYVSHEIVGEGIEMRLS